MQDLSEFFNMATSSSSNVGVSSKSAKERWASVSAVPQPREDRLPMELAVPMWQKIYSLFGAKGEKDQDEAFVAVQGFFCANGCSPAGHYSREVKTGGGVVVPSSDIVKVTGRLEGDVRKFLRARMRDSYEALKYSAVVMQDEVLLQKAESVGIPRSMAFLLADWLKDCECFNAEEQDLYQKVSRRTLEAARVRRTKPSGETAKRADAGEEEVSPEVHQGGAFFSAPVSY